MCYLACPVERAHDQVRLVRRQHDFQLHHSTRQIPPPNAPLIGRQRLIRGQCAAIPAAQPFELRARGDHRHLQQLRFGHRRCHAGERPRLCVRQLAHAQGLVDRRQLAESTCHPHLLARCRRVQPNTPGQPVRTRGSALFVPSTGLVELPNAGQQPVRSRIHMRRQVRYLPTQILDGQHSAKLNICSAICQGENASVCANSCARERRQESVAAGRRPTRFRATKGAETRSVACASSGVRQLQ